MQDSLIAMQTAPEREKSHTLTLLMRGTSKDTKPAAKFTTRLAASQRLVILGLGKVAWLLYSLYLIFVKIIKYEVSINCH